MYYKTESDLTVSISPSRVNDNVDETTRSHANNERKGFQGFLLRNAKAPPESTGEGDAACTPRLHTSLDD